MGEIMREWRIIVAICVLLPGCSAVREQHHFAEYSKSAGPELANAKPAAFYRLTVKGNVRGAGARYVSGFYDEDAMDLYFNEIKPKTRDLFSQPKTEGVDTSANGGAKGATEVLSAKPTDGAYMLVLSSHAKAVVQAIGNFAQAKDTADQIAALLGRNDRRAEIQSEAFVSVGKESAKAEYAEFDALRKNAAENPTTANYVALVCTAILSQSIYNGLMQAFLEAVEIAVDTIGANQAPDSIKCLDNVFDCVRPLSSCNYHHFSSRV